MKLQIRWLICRDMGEVRAIESEETIDRLEDEEQFLVLLRQRNCIGVVGEVDGRIVAYMIYELHKKRLHIIKFRVAESCTGNGYGSAMIIRLIDKLSQQRRNEIRLEVNEQRLDFLMFLKRQGFFATGMHGEEITMSYKLDGHQFEPTNRISNYTETER